MTNCPKCDSNDLKKTGMRFVGSQRGRGFSCNSCGNKFAVTEEELNIQASVTEVKDFEEVFHTQDPQTNFQEELDRGLKSRRFVLTCAVNNSEVNETFLKTLERYCDENGAGLIVMPVKYRNPSLLTVIVGEGEEEEFWYHPRVMKYLTNSNFKLPNQIKCLGGIMVQATAENPLTGIDGLSKGMSVIVPHPQVSLKTLPRQIRGSEDTYPPIATTTGCVTQPEYSETKAGFKANFNHSYSAVVVEYTEGMEETFIRHLNFDGSGFYDLDSYWNVDGVVRNTNIEAIVTGDTHEFFQHKGVYKATWEKGGIVDVLMPRYIVRHDVLDFISRTHHSEKDVFINFAKHHDSFKKSGNVEKELEGVVNFLNETTPDWPCVNVIVDSNHHSHLRRWLNEADPKKDPENALFYHKMMYNVLSQTRIDESGSLRSPDPFELYLKSKVAEPDSYVFLSANDSYKIMGIEVSMHGHVGVNGARGNVKAFANTPDKTITGHSHSPMIDKGAWVVGTSCIFNMPYCKGMSTWDHAHAIIHANGKRQMIFIRNGKWRA